MSTQSHNSVTQSIGVQGGVQMSGPQSRNSVTQSFDAQGGVQTSGLQSGNSVTQSFGTQGGVQMSDFSVQSTRRDNLSSVGVNTVNRTGQKSTSTGTGSSNVNTSEATLQTYQQSLMNSISTQGESSTCRSMKLVF